ncbi:MAG: iron-sulfur protein [Streptomyces oryziradicis]|nr:iron-sulfur protein [Actinacidiphila oryziradicis]
MARHVPCRRIRPPHRGLPGPAGHRGSTARRRRLDRRVRARRRRSRAGTPSSPGTRSNCSAKPATPPDRTSSPASACTATPGRYACCSPSPGSCTAGCLGSPSPMCRSTAPPGRLTVRPRGFACLPEDPASALPGARVVPDTEALRAELRAAVAEHLAPVLDGFRPRMRRGRRAMWGTATDEVTESLWRIGVLLGEEDRAVAELGAPLPGSTAPYAGAADFRTLGAPGTPDGTAPRPGPDFVLLLLHPAPGGDVPDLPSYVRSGAHRTARGDPLRTRRHIRRASVLFSCLSSSILSATPHATPSLAFSCPEKASRGRVVRQDVARTAVSRPERDGKRR